MADCAKYCGRISAVVDRMRVGLVRLRPALALVHPRGEGRLVDVDEGRVLGNQPAQY